MGTLLHKKHLQGSSVVCSSVDVWNGADKADCIWKGFSSTQCVSWTCSPTETRWRTAALTSPPAASSWSWSSGRGSNVSRDLYHITSPLFTSVYTYLGVSVYLRIVIFTLKQKYDKSSNVFHLLNSPRTSSQSGTQRLLAVFQPAPPPRRLWQVTSPSCLHWLIQSKYSLW